MESSGFVVWLCFGSVMDMLCGRQAVCPTIRFSHSASRRGSLAGVADAPRCRLLSRALETSLSARRACRPCSYSISWRGSGHGCSRASRFLSVLHTGGEEAL